jgi:hypothetical protein
VQDRLRQQLCRWGLPGAVRVDYGHPWGIWNDLPTAFALWLVGLGVELWLSPVGQKQLQGVVEKSQDTGQRWAEPGSCRSVAELQAHLDAMDRIQREEYPSLHGRSRLAVFPQLRQPLRDYSVSWEEEHWELRRAQDYLAGHTAVRRANVRGQVSVYNRHYSVGVGHRHEPVRVYYEVDTGEWVFLSAAGAVLRRLQATEISRERIRSLDVSA